MNIHLQYHNQISLVLGQPVYPIFVRCYYQLIVVLMVRMEDLKITHDSFRPRRVPMLRDHIARIRQDLPDRLKGTF